MSRTFGRLLVLVSMCAIVLNFVSLQKWNKIEFDDQVAYAGDLGCQIAACVTVREGVPTTTRIGCFYTSFYGWGIPCSGCYWC